MKKLSQFENLKLEDLNNIVGGRKKATHVFSKIVKILSNSIPVI